MDNEHNGHLMDREHDGHEEDLMDRDEENGNTPLASHELHHHEYDHDVEHHEGGHRPCFFFKLNIFKENFYCYDIQS